MQDGTMDRVAGPNNTHTSYGSVERALHWAVAALLITGAVLGKVAYEWPYDSSASLSTKATLFSLHKTVGVSVFFLALIRIGWALTPPRPRPLHPERRWETRLASTVHWMLYGSLVLVPLSGWAHHAASSGFAPILWPFGQELPFIPKDPIVSVRFGRLHELLIKVLFVSLALHIAGTLKHVFVDRDLTFARMWSGRDPGALPKEKASALPVLMAALIWAGALGIGLLAGRSLVAPTERVQDTAAPAGNWIVEDGTLSIEVLQMGQSVTGRFADWDAVIEFDETAASGQAGTVTVRVDTGSLSLGSVSSDAMGPDFLDASGFPEAVFDADILREGGAYVAEGTLSLRGVSAPVRLPFTLDVQDGTAVMAGSVTLDRRDFGVGQSYSDEADVGFSVTVSTELRARQR